MTLKRLKSFDSDAWKRSSSITLTETTSIAAAEMLETACVVVVCVQDSATAMEILGDDDDEEEDEDDGDDDGDEGSSWTNTQCCATNAAASGQCQCAVFSGDDFIVCDRDPLPAMPPSLPKSELPCWSDASAATCNLCALTTASRWCQWSDESMIIFTFHMQLQ